MCKERLYEILFSVFACYPSIQSMLQNLTDSNLIVTGDLKIAAKKVVVISFVSILYSSAQVLMIHVIGILVPFSEDFIPFGADNIGQDSQGWTNDVIKQLCELHMPRMQQFNAGDYTYKKKVCFK